MNDKYKRFKTLTEEKAKIDAELDVLKEEIKTHMELNGITSQSTTYGKFTLSTRVTKKLFEEQDKMVKELKAGFEKAQLFSTTKNSFIKYKK